ncbi:MAG: hypothetical protein IT261_14255 [Saprospiraceae bacterium]|nr:hypothetical protein [Saprospiraceae bacterium]
MTIIFLSRQVTFVGCELDIFCWEKLPNHVHAFKKTALLMKRIVTLISFFLLMVLSELLSGQTALSAFEKKKPHSAPIITSPTWKRVGETEKSSTSLWPIPPAAASPASVVFLPSWRAETLPFFCRIEHQWARQYNIPLKFRLGSVEYVDWLEGK